MTNTQVLKFRKALANNCSDNIKLSKIQLQKIGQLGGFLGRLLKPLVKTGLPLRENVRKPLAKSFLISLVLTTAASATYVAIHKKMFGSGMTTLIISNEEMNDISKIVQPLKGSSLLIKSMSEKIKNEVKEQNGGFLTMLLGTLDACLLRNLLTDKSTIRAGKDF